MTLAYYHKAYVNKSGEGGALNFFLVVMCHVGFQKQGLGSGFSLPNEGSLGVKIQKFCILRAEILAKGKAENAIFFYKLKKGGGHMSSTLMVNW